jgi:cation/acetate symporter
MELQALIYLFVGITFTLYIGIALWTKAASTKEFYIANSGISPITNGMAIAAEWISAASFISLAGIISFQGNDGSAYLMGWTGGYVLLAMLFVPYLRKFGKFTLSDFIGDRYYSNTAKLLTIISIIFISFVYVSGQIRGIGIIFSRFLEVDVDIGIIIAMCIVFFYTVFGGMKGITYTQVAQYIVMTMAYMIPAIFLSLQITDTFLPQLSIFSKTTFAFDTGVQIIPQGTYLLHALDQSLLDLGFTPYTQPANILNVFMLTAALMLGTAALPHVIIKFFTVPTVNDARVSAAWALIFIAIMYTTISSVASFSRINIIKNIQNVEYKPFINGEIEDINGIINHGRWFQAWENSGLLAWNDRNSDGKIQYAAGNAFDAKDGKPNYDEMHKAKDTHRLTTNPAKKSTDSELINSNGIANELYIDEDIITLANPEIANLPNWIIALIASGALAAALATASGLLIVITSSISHDLIGQIIFKDKITGKTNLNEKAELMLARISIVVAILIAGYLGINPSAYVAQTVAFAFGLAAATFFPSIILGIFDKRMNKEGAIAGIIVGFIFTSVYIFYFTFINIDTKDYLFGINPSGIGTIGTLLHLIVALIVSRLTPAPPAYIGELVDKIRIPSGATEAYEF